MAMLYELDNQGQDKFVSTCNSCKTPVETRYHCTFCDDFDLCIQCYEKEGHPHKMEKLGFDLDDGSSYVQFLVHACQCRDANCRLASCQKMKRIVTHTKVCKRKTNGGCPICKQLIALCYFHAKHCQETKCPVPFCLNIRHKVKNVIGDGNMQSGSGSGVPPVCVPRAFSPVETMNSSMGALTLSGGGMQQSHQPDIKQVQEEAPRQQAPLGVGFGKVNPGSGVPGQNMPPPQMHMRSGGHISLEQDFMLLSLSSQVGQGQGPLPSDLMQQPNPGVGVRQSAAAIFTPSTNTKQALQQLMIALKSPSKPEQQQQILHILMANPQLMAAFIKQRQLGKEKKRFKHTR